MMVKTSRAPVARVRFSDPEAPGGVDVSTDAFLRDCKRSAVARFGGRGKQASGCRTIEHRVPPKGSNTQSTGMIVAHVSPAVWEAWQTSASGPARERRAHVEGELHLALEDLADQDMHGYLALTETQCDFYGPDLVQLVTEALDRTTFSHLGVPSAPRWEGTLVERVRPPYLVLAVSIDFHGRRRRRASRSPRDKLRSGSAT